MKAMPTTFSDPDGEGDFNGFDFERFLQRLLEVRYSDHGVLPGDHGTDLSFTRDGEYTVVQVKRSPPLTATRINQTVEELRRHVEGLQGRDAHARVKLVLATPSALSVGNLKTFHDAGIDVWDRDWIWSAAESANMANEAARFIGRAGHPARHSHAQELQRRLVQIRPGRADWPAYQKLCGEILDYLFCPPLSAPISERTNEAENNRRDFILPNYSNGGFWAFLRDRYHADHIVVDAKNYTGEIKKAEVLQLANYLSLHGPGHFGIIVTRKGADSSALVTRREQWTVYSKLILVLDDEDIKQMLKAKEASEDPDLLIRQKIEDFRLSI
jgi:hypothetical protein